MCFCIYYCFSFGFSSLNKEINHDSGNWIQQPWWLKSGSRSCPAFGWWSKQKSTSQNEDFLLHWLEGLVPYQYHHKLLLSYVTKCCSRYMTDYFIPVPPIFSGTGYTLEVQGRVGSCLCPKENKNSQFNVFTLKSLTGRSPFWSLERGSNLQWKTWSILK